jgi:hypothetical protein
MTAAPPPATTAVASLRVLSRRGSYAFHSRVVNDVGVNVLFLAPHRSALHVIILPGGQGAVRQQQGVSLPGFTAKGY